LRTNRRCVPKRYFSRSAGATHKSTQATPSSYSTLHKFNRACLTFSRPCTVRVILRVCVCVRAYHRLNSVLKQSSLTIVEITPTAHRSSVVHSRPLTNAEHVLLGSALERAAALLFRLFPAAASAARQSSVAAVSVLESAILPTDTNELLSSESFLEYCTKRPNPPAESLYAVWLTLSLSWLARTRYSTTSLPSTLSTPRQWRLWASNGACAATLALARASSSRAHAEQRLAQVAAALLHRLEHLPVFGIDLASLVADPISRVRTHFAARHHRYCCSI